MSPSPPEDDSSSSDNKQTRPLIIIYLFPNSQPFAENLPELVTHVDPVDGDQGGVEEPHHVGGHDPGVEEPLERILDNGASQTNDLTAHADQHTLISHSLRHDT